MFRSQVLFSISTLVLLLTSSAHADSLPATAKPMSAEEITKIYSGNSAIWKVSDVYFAPDGTDIGIFGKPKPKGKFSGKWSVNGNEACMVNGDKTDCWKWWADGKRRITLWSQHYDGTPVDETNGYYQEKDIKRGDLVSKRYAAMPGS